MLGLTSLAWDEVRSHPLRTLLTLLSVAIGVGAVVAVHCTRPPRGSLLPDSTNR